MKNMISGRSGADRNLYFMAGLSLFGVLSVFLDSNKGYKLCLLGLGFHGVLFIGYVIRDAVRGRDVKRN